MAQEKLNLKDAKKYARDYIHHLEDKYKLPITTAYLFGSFGRGKPRRWSDIDVCVVSDKFNRVDPLVYLWTKRRDIDIERGIEPYGIHPKDFVEENPVAYEIKRTGIILRK